MVPSVEIVWNRLFGPSMQVSEETRDNHGLGITSVHARKMIPLKRKRRHVSYSGNSSLDGSGSMKLATNPIP